MKKIVSTLIVIAACVFYNEARTKQQAKNPIIFADVPDLSMIRWAIGL